MRKIVYRLALCLSVLLLNTQLFAQTTVNESGAEDVMRSNGKIYVVMAVCLTILVILFLYLIRIDRKISKLEKNNL